MVPQFLLPGGPGKESAAQPARSRAKLRVRTCPAAASPAPPAGAPASRPRRAGSRIPIGARGAHTDPTGPRAACQACPSRAGGRRLAGAQARGHAPPEPSAPGICPPSPCRSPVPRIPGLGYALPRGQPPDPRGGGATCLGHQIPATSTSSLKTRTCPASTRWPEP